jgi:hypothetical protein
VCGSLQKLPGGRLSKHGYTVAHGFFEGVCFGEGELPYEQSCDLVKESIARANERAASLDAFAAEVEADTEHAWVEHYVSASFARGQRQSRREWRRHPVAAVLSTWTGESGDVHVNAIDPEAERGSIARLSIPFEVTYGADDKVAATRAHLNAARAKAARRVAEQAREYARAQQRRVDAWKPQPLHPIEK